jgi:hypothetical protein
MTRALVLLALIPALAPGLAATPASAQGAFARPAPDLVFRVVPDPELATRGGPAVIGYVYNETANRAGDVRLRAEVLDESGQVIGEGLGWVYGAVPPHDRGFFIVKVPRRGASYRVTVVSYSWLAIGGGAQAP